MIYSTNRTQSLGDVTVAANENYFGNGYLDFIQECYEDELAIFENAIKSDIDEFISEGSDLQAVTEAFVEKAKEQLAKLMQKFLEWIESVKTSVIKKFDEVYVKSVNLKVKELTEKFNKLKGDTKFTGKAFTSNEPLAIGDKMFNDILDCKQFVLGQPTKENVESIEAKVKNVKDIDKKSLDSSLVELKDKSAKEVFDDQVKIINSVKGIIETVRKALAEEKTVAKQILKDCKKAKKESEDKDAAALKMQAASAYRTLCVETLKVTMKMLRVIISKALDTMVLIIKQNKASVEEGVELDVDMLDLATESFIYEMEASLQDFSEGCKHEECDDDECCDDDEEDDEE